AAVVAAHFGSVPGSSGVLLVNPVPVEYELDSELHDRLLRGGMELLAAKGTRGGDVTPVLLEHFHTASGGKSLDANEALVLDNTRVAAQVSVELAREPR